MPTAGHPTPKKKIHFIALGSRGDTQPVVVGAKTLARLAKQRGLAIQPVVLTHGTFETWATQECQADGIDVRCYMSNVEAEMNAPDTSQAALTGNVMDFLGKWEGLPFHTNFATIREHCHDADALICGVLSLPMAVVLLKERQHQGRPLSIGLQLTVLPDKCSLYPPLYAPPDQGEHLPPEERAKQNVASHQAASQVWWDSVLEPWINSKLKACGVPLYSSADEYYYDVEHMPTHGVFSSVVIPRDPIWPSTFTVGGFVFPDLATLPPLRPEVEAFLATHKKTISRICFGVWASRSAAKGNNRF